MAMMANKFLPLLWDYQESTGSSFLTILIQDAVASCLNYSPYLNAPFLITAYSIISILSFEKCAKKGKHSANYSQSAFLQVSSLVVI